MCDTTEGPHMDQPEDRPRPPRRHNTITTRSAEKGPALPRTLTSRHRLGHVCLPTGYGPKNTDPCFQEACGQYPLARLTKGADDWNVRRGHGRGALAYSSCGELGATLRATRARAWRERHENYARLRCLHKKRGAVACRSGAKSAAHCIPQCTWSVGHVV